MMTALSRLLLLSFHSREPHHWLLDDQQRQAQCEAVYAELEHEVNGARSSGRKAELRDALAQFIADCPGVGNPSGLAEKLKPQPILSTDQKR